MNKKEKQTKINFINRQIKAHYATEDPLKLAERLGITLSNLRVKAKRLGVSRSFVNDIVDGQFKLCPHCGMTLPIGNFNRDKFQRSGYDYYCRTCRNIKKIQKAHRKQEENCKNHSLDPKAKVDMAFKRGKEANPIVMQNGIQMLRCKSCMTLKELDNFHNDKRNVTGKKNYCKTCLKLKRENKL